jgi:hypothetical protein
MNISLPAGTLNEVMRMVVVSSVVVTPPSEGESDDPLPSVAAPPSETGIMTWFIAGEHPPNASSKAGRAKVRMID